MQCLWVMATYLVAPQTYTQCLLVMATYLVASPDVHAAPIGDGHMPAALRGAVVLQLLEAVLSRCRELLVGLQVLVVVSHVDRVLRAQNDTVWGLENQQGKAGEGKTRGRAVVPLTGSSAWKLAPQPAALRLRIADNLRGFQLPIYTKISVLFS